MPECPSCGTHVTEDYVRVFGVDGEIDGCPSCPDKTRVYGKAGVREKRNVATDGGEQ